MWGVMQGRLSPPVSGKIQEFPVEWEEEIYISKKIGLSHIDWLITESSLEKNPIFSVGKIESIGSICMDNLVDENFFQPDFFYKNLSLPCRAFSSMGYRSITIPLLEKSSIFRKKNKFLNFKKQILLLSRDFPEMEFHFEVEKFDKNFDQLISLSPNFYLVYDTGNVSDYYSMKNQEKIIKKYRDKIKIVHLKDKSDDGTVPPGKGRVDFKLIFSLFNSRSGEIKYTIQTARGESGLEEQTIKNHISFFKSKYEQYL